MGTLNLLPENQRGQPVFAWLDIRNGWEMLRNIRFHINIYTNEIKAGTPNVCAVESVLTVTAGN